MNRKILLVLLAILLAFTCSVGVSASTAANFESQTLEQRINGLTLTPKPAPDRNSYPGYWDSYDFSQVTKIAENSSLTNYEKLKAVFLDVAEIDATACTYHRTILAFAVEMLGFDVYNVSGLTQTKNGGLPMTYGSLPEGWGSHAWVAVIIDGTPKNVVVYNAENPPGPQDITVGSGIELSDITGEVIYFDTNLYATYGMTFEQCFAVLPQNATWYRNANLVVGY